MSSRITQTFAALRGRAALIPYLTAGAPHPASTVNLMTAFVQGGADILELGVPFSDPMADGPVIQQAVGRALDHGTTLADVLEMVRVFRRQNQETPVVLMGYYNPVLAMGVERFAQHAAEVGVDGVLTVDLPLEAANTLDAALRAQRIDTIYLLAPTTPAARVRAVMQQASGYVYYVSLKGVTGADTLDTQTLGQRIAELRSYQSTPLPIGVGFGIHNEKTAAAVGLVADAVIIGSWFVQEIARLGGGGATQLANLVRGVRTAMAASAPPEGGMGLTRHTADG